MCHVYNTHGLWLWFLWRVKTYPTQFDPKCICEDALAFRAQASKVSVLKLRVSFKCLSSECEPCSSFRFTVPPFQCFNRSGFSQVASTLMQWQLWISLILLFRHPRMTFDLATRNSLCITQCSFRFCGSFLFFRNLLFVLVWPCLAMHSICFLLSLALCWYCFYIIHDNKMSKLVFVIISSQPVTHQSIHSHQCSRLFISSIWKRNGECG